MWTQKNCLTIAPHPDDSGWLHSDEQEASDGHQCDDTHDSRHNDASIRICAKGAIHLVEFRSFISKLCLRHLPSLNPLACRVSRGIWWRHTARPSLHGHASLPASHCVAGSEKRVSTGS